MPTDTFDQLHDYCCTISSDGRTLAQYEIAAFCITAAEAEALRQYETEHGRPEGSLSIHVTQL